MERSRRQVLVAVEPRLLGDSLSIALDRTGEWDIVQLNPAGDDERDPVEAVILTTGVASVVRSDIVIELPHVDSRDSDGYVEIHGQRHPTALPTISAIIDALRRAEDDLDAHGQAASR